MINKPIDVPRKLLTKKRLPISIRFAQRKGYPVIQIRISVAGCEGSPFSTLSNGKTLSTAHVLWSQSQQRAVNPSNEARKTTAHTVDKTMRKWYINLTTHQPFRRAA